MKIRHPAALKLAGLLGSWCIRGLMKTISHRSYCLGAADFPPPPWHQQKYLFCFWHENLLAPCAFFARPDVKVLISQHADGELIARVCQHLGFGVVRGSTTRGGMAALRQLIRDSTHCSLAVTPDGPRGPRRQVEPGLVYLAAKTGLPIVPLGVGYSNAWRLKTWDRFCIPKPFSRAATTFGQPLVIPAKVGRAELAHYADQVRLALDQAGVQAQLQATEGRTRKAA